MKATRPLFFNFTVLSFWLLMAMGCTEKKQAGRVEQPIQRSELDTAKVHQALRTYEAKELRIADPEGAGMLRSILNESMAMGYNDQACLISMDFARFYADQGNFDSTLFYFNQARPYCNNPFYDKTLPAAFLNEFGAFYHSLRSDNVAANNSYYQALNYLKANNLTENELTINLYLYLFATQEHLGHPEQALIYLKEAENLAMRLNSNAALVAVRTHLGNYYSERQGYQTSRKYFDLAVQNAKQHWNPDWDPNIMIAALVGKASVRTKTGEAASAIPIFKEAIQFAREHRVIYSEVVAAIELGRAYNQLGRFQETVQLVTGALRAQGQAFNWYKEEGYKVLMDAYEGLGQYKTALEYQRKLYAFNDSLTNKETTVALNELEVKFQTASKDKEIASKQLLVEQQNNKLTRNKILIAGLAVAAVLAVLFLIIFYKNAAQKQRVQELEINSLKRQQEINMLRSTMKGEEQERKRLSRELHDGIGSMIASIIMRLSALKKQGPELVTSQAYEDVLQMLQETGREVRKTAHNIMPDIVDKLTLPEAIKGYCATISQGTDLKIDVQFYGDTDNFSSDCKLAIYRIVQELVHNIVKHAKATHAIVQGVASEDTFTLTVEDNGTGFDTATALNGLGLKNVESRVRSLFGEFQMESAPGKGTTVNMDFDCRYLNREAAQVGVAQAEEQ